MKIINMFPRSRPGRLLLGGALGTSFLGFVVVTAYGIAVGAQEKFNYSVIAPTVIGAGLGAALAGCLLTILLRSASKIKASPRSSAFVGFGAYALLVLLFLFLFSECEYGCTNKAMSESKSPDGTWSAVWTEKKCSSVARYCRPTSSVVLIQNGHPDAHERGPQEVFRAKAYGNLNVRWNAANSLLIGYTSQSDVLIRQNQFGPIRVYFEPIPFM